MRGIKKRLDRTRQTAVAYMRQQIMAEREAMSLEELEVHDALLAGTFISAVECGFLSREEAKARWPNLTRMYIDEDTGET